ncbi:LamG-like jellyroll fold domain-containing protein [Actinomadura geliboluensis]
MAHLVALLMVAGLLQVPIAVVALESAGHADEPKVTAAQGAETEQEAVAAAEQTGEPVEVTSRRGERRTVRALPSGRIEVEQHLQPIRARQGGEWVGIDATLRRSGDAIVPAATTVGLRFSAGGNGPMVEMTRAGRKLALTWPQSLPEPALDGDTAVYAGVAGPDVDLRLRAMPDGFAHVLVIKTADAAKDPRVASLSLALSATRLTVTEEQDSGILKATDPSSGAVVFQAPSPLMWDSSQPAAPAPQTRTQTTVDAAEEPGEGAKTAVVDVAVGDGALTLTPDQGLLSAPDTTFPVYIDPMYRTLLASSWGMVSSGYPDENYPLFDGRSTEGMGRCEVAKDSRCVKDQTKRLFYRMELPPLKGRYIQSAEFIAYETSAYNCSNSTVVELWRTSAYTSSATWNNTKRTWPNGGAWGEVLDTRDVAYCSRAPVEFGGAKLREHVQDAIGKGYGTITFGLKAYNETTMDWWKRFAEDAYLKVQYNNPPLQPDNDTMFADPGTKCLPSWEAQTVNRIPTVYAYLKDPDTEDRNKVRGQFALNWDAGDGKGFIARWFSDLTAAKASNSRFDTPLPSNIPPGKLIGWNVRAYDGEQYGPWASDGAQIACYFYYDPAKPGKPTITSTDYPQDGAEHGGVGQPGTFTIADSAGVADRYLITLNGGPSRTVATTAGAAQQVQIAPTRFGPNVLTVQALAPSNQNGPVVSYEFRANKGSAPVASFALDEPAGATAVQAVTRDGEPAVSATVHGGATLGTVGHIDQAVQLDGSTGYASTSAPLVDTSQSFAVSVWAKVDASDPDNDFAALSMEGVHESAFYLKYVKDTRKWVFGRTATDTTDAPGWYQASSAAPARTGEWTHLVGVWDALANTMQIYVNGDRGNDSPVIPAMWKATGGLQIGRSKYKDVQLDHWPGQLDDVRIYDRIVGDEEIKKMVTDHPVLKARWMLNETGEADSFPPGAPDLLFHNGAAIDPGAGFGWGASMAGLMLGAGTFAETLAPPVWTNESFTIAGWVRNMGRPQQAATVFSQPGTQANAFVLRYVPGEDPVDQGSWQVALRGSDDAAAAPIVVSHSNFSPGDWVHLAVVYDALRDRVSLYVNGQLDETAGGVSQEDGAIPFEAKNNGGLQVGRNKFGAADGTEFWPDAVDDLWVYQAALTQPQLASLAVDVELPSGSRP